MITIEKFGELPDGQIINAYRLHAPNKMTAAILNYGATLQSLCLPNGQDIVLGFDSLNDYLSPHPYFGTAIGRVANRIYGGRFIIDGQSFQVDTNEGPNTLHSGPGGFDRKVWDVELGQSSISLKHVSPHNDQGYPGELQTIFRYALDNEGLRLDMIADSSAPTPVNLTGHSYFNLGDATINDHALSLNAESFCIVDAAGINHGETRELKSSSFDFMASRKISETQIDHHFNLAGTHLRKMATLFSPKGERRLTILSDLPGFQVYTGDFIGKHTGKGGNVYQDRSGIAFEPQYPPNAINLQTVPETILRPGETWEHSILYKIEERPLR